jgi:hypothetical protein
MGVERRGWSLSDSVIAVGVVVALLFALIGLTGSDVNHEAGQVLGCAAAVVLFTILGSAGAALVHLQPRFALIGVATVALSLLAGGASIVSVWSEGPSLFGFFGYAGTSGTVGAITDLLAITASATCVLLATVRVGEDRPTQLVRVAAIGALALLIALAILAIVDHSIEIGARVYAIFATVYVVATAVLLVLRPLPIGDEAPASG